MSEINLLSLLDEPIEATSFTDTEILMGYCPDSNYCLKMGRCMSGCTSGPGFEQEYDPEGIAENDTLVSARCTDRSACTAAGFCVGGCGVGHNVIIEPIV